MRRGVTMIGLLVSMTCMLVLVVLMMEGIQSSGPAVGKGGGKGGGGAAGSAMGLVDTSNLNQIHQTFRARSTTSGKGFPVPSEQSRDRSLDTSANVWSLMIAESGIPTNMLVSAMDDGWVEVYEHYNESGYDPHNGIYWDAGFSADLDDVSNVSYAHVPLHGSRKRNWTEMIGMAPSSFPLMGHRGPEDGVETEDSVTCPGGVWQGAVVFGDGHVDTLQGVGAFGKGHDNLFMLEDEGGSDAILGFTEVMYSDGPKLQWD